MSVQVRKPRHGRVRPVTSKAGSFLTFQGVDPGPRAPGKAAAQPRAQRWKVFRRLTFSDSVSSSGLSLIQSNLCIEHCCALGPPEGMRGTKRGSLSGPESNPQICALGSRAPGTCWQRGGHRAPTGKQEA